MLIIACTLCAPLVAQNVQRFSSVNPAWFGYTAKDVELTPPRKYKVLLQKIEDLTPYLLK